jgi:hypothetical protein
MRLLLSLLLVFLTVFFAHKIQAQTQSSEQILATLDKCREQVISQLSFSNKMKMRSAMGAIQDNPQFIAANAAVANAPNPGAKIDARKSLAKLKLDLIEKRDPSLRPVLEQIRTAQAALLQ